MNSIERQYYRQFLPVIRKWGDFVIVQQHRGTTALGVREILLRCGLDEEAVEAVFDMAGTKFARYEAIRKYWWKIPLGIIISLSGLFLTVLLAKGLYLSFTGLPMIAIGIRQFFSYAECLQED